MTNGLRYPSDCRAIIDVTKPPYNVDNTGTNDCTAQLRRIVNDALGAYERNFYETKLKLEGMDDPNALVSFEIRKVDGRANVIFPETLPDSRIVYFPNGTYLVSDTISYAQEEFRNFLFGLRHLEMNGQLRFAGESRDGVVIKLKDNCPGFEFGNDRPVISFMQGEASNIAMTNMLENMTNDIGSGNPGATGVVFFANNTGAVRDVRIVSSDPEYRGNTGFAVVHDKVSACYLKNLEVTGFRYGVKVTPQTHFTVFEHIRLSRQLRCGFFVGNTIVSIRDLQSDNWVPALRLQGVTAFVALVDGDLRGGNPLDSAVRYEFGQLLLRNVRSEGYEFAAAGIKDYVAEYGSHGPKTLFSGIDARTLALSVEETPETAWDDPEEWVSVNEYGAVGDGLHDDTAAIQLALNSGRSTVYFQPGRYLIDGQIRVPATVNRINFMYGDLAAGSRLTTMRGGIFVVDEEADTPLVIEDLFAWEKLYGFMTLIDHASRRTLILSDVHVQAASLYFNSVTGGKIFIENTGCTIGGVPGAGVRQEKLPWEEKFPYSRETPCFHFIGQEVYCRQLNPERSLREVVNDGGRLWVLGFKTEEEGTAFATYNGGSTEVLGGTFCIGLDKPYPLVLNDNSNVSVFASTCLYSPLQRFPLAVREIRQGDVRELRGEDLPIRFMHSYTIPLYVGRSGEVGHAV
ncbi:glycosyl hydrolase family 28-related protein [Cohnella fermenti]|uniref:Rhamnogalacturonase A/B/Epimerase-like pectate lyase domain-containing protein n=1 Tax=Cohnella fermenti TaxID=2565925 RepID=A0A4S4C637_9BACL|nr:glycosyl hydrolase family 28-related protein [Cohnella fermenti]THF83332.1 hypothetical protein E6C55_05640 [Cohnella fermenti]